MKSKIRNPFGEVESESEFNSPSPLRIDKEEALKDIKTSLLLWKKRKVTKKSFFQSFFKKKILLLKRLTGNSRKNQGGWLISI